MKKSGSLWTIFKDEFSKISSAMVKIMITKLVKMEAILMHLPRCVFKIFFNHGEGNDYEISQNESHSSASSKVKFQHFHQLWKEMMKK